MNPCIPSPSRLLENETEFDYLAGSLNQLDAIPATNNCKPPCPCCGKREKERSTIRGNGQKPTCNAAWFPELKPEPPPVLSQEKARPVSFVEASPIELQVLHRTYSARLMTQLWVVWWRLTWRSSRHTHWSDD